MALVDGEFEWFILSESLLLGAKQTLLIIFLLLYLNFRSITETMIVMLSLPFALVGGLWLMWWLGFNLSVAVAVGFIALAGVAAETGVVMLIYLNQALAEVRARRQAENRPLTRRDLYDAIMEGAVERVRPKMMTVVAIMAGLLPIMWSTGAGSEIMQRIAVPMIGGMVSSALLTLIVIPAIFGIVKGFGLPPATRAIDHCNPRSAYIAMHESENGIKRKWCDVRSESAFKSDLRAVRAAFDDVRSPRQSRPRGEERQN
jgi:Cu/Ag efflux pump CusA